MNAIPSTALTFVQSSSLLGTLMLITVLEIITTVSFFLSAWQWGRMIRREPADAIGRSSVGFGISFGLLTIAPAGVAVWYLLGAQTTGFDAPTLLAYFLLTALAPGAMYYLPFQFPHFPGIRVVAHLVFAACVSAAFWLLLGLNGQPGPLIQELLSLLWMGMFMVFSTWEAHGWAFVEQVPTADGFIQWMRDFTGTYRDRFLKMFALWHYYFVCGLVIVLNFGLGFLNDLSSVAPPLDSYAEWALRTGPITTATYALVGMGVMLLSVYIETVQKTREVRDRALTEQGSLEADLRMTQARYASVLQNAPYPVFQFDRRMHVNVENLQASELLHRVDPKRQAGTGTLPLPPSFLDACQRAFNGQRVVVEDALVLRGADSSGSTATGRWYRMTCDPVLDAAGQCIAAVAVLDDQTDRYYREVELKRLSAEAELSRSAAQNASMAKSRFLANMSHEIRTPMNGLYSAIQLLRDPRLAEEKRGRVLDTLKRSADSMIKLLNDILDLSKVEAGAMRLQLEPTCLGDVAREVMGLFQAAAHTKQLDFQMHCAVGDDGKVEADDLRLTQMLSNLVGNAVKFTQRGSIRLEIAQVADDADGRRRYRFSVTDTGLGIRDHELLNVFNAYHQLENQQKGMSDSNDAKGTGLGLTIVKHLAELMNGEVGVDSTPGVGSTFWFEIPLRPIA